MPEMIDIGDVAHETVLVERCRAAAKPRWIERGAQPLAHAGRNPFLHWQTMGDVAIHAWRVRDVVLDASTMLLLKDGRIIRETNYLRPAEELASMRVDPDRLIRIETSLPVLVCGDAWSSNHYHWLMHTLPAIDSSIARNGRGGICLAMLPPRPVQNRTLALLGHDPSPGFLLEPGRQYAIPEAEFCQFTAGVADFAVSPLSQAMHDRIGAAVPDDGASARRIYVTRIDDAHRRMHGEVQLMKKLARRGFDIVDMAKMTLEQQVATFRNAEFVVAPHGAGLVNMIFCRPGARIYELIPKQYDNPCFAALSIRRGVHYWADAFEGDGDGPAFLRDWTVDIDAVLARVEEIEERRQGWLPAMPWLRKGKRIGRLA